MVNGKKQATNQAKFLGSPKSYQSVFFKVKAMARKEVKQVITPKTKPNFTTLLVKTFANPEIASSEVLDPEAPRTIKINKR